MIQIIGGSRPTSLDVYNFNGIGDSNREESPRYAMICHHHNVLCSAFSWLMLCYWDFIGNQDSNREEPPRCVCVCVCVCVSMCVCVCVYTAAMPTSIERNHLGMLCSCCALLCSCSALALLLLCSMLLLCSCSGFALLLLDLLYLLPQSPRVEFKKRKQKNQAVYWPRSHSFF
jgi:hypothetical protein